MGLIRKELLHIAEEWNQHLISKSLNGGPSGRPDTMFFLSHLYDSENYMQNIAQDEVLQLQAGIINLPLDFSIEFKEFAEELMNEEGIENPSNSQEALELYVFLLEKIAVFSQ